MLRRMDMLFGYLCKFDRKLFELNIILNRFGSATFKKLMQKGVDLSFFRQWYYVNLIFIYSWERYINIKVPHYSREYLLKVVHYEEDQRKSGNSSLFSDCKWSIHISGKICECPRESGLGVCLYIYTYKYIFVCIYICQPFLQEQMFVILLMKWICLGCNDKAFSSSLLLLPSKSTERRGLWSTWLFWPSGTPFSKEKMLIYWK